MIRAEVTGRAATTVSAQGAGGIEIARIVSSISEGRIQLVVTVRDVTRRLIRGAAVGLTPLPGTALHAASRATFTNQRGRVTFRVRVPKTYRGSRVRFLITARTPTAHTSELVSVRAPH